MSRARVPPGPGQESVWDYPRPPRVEDCPKPVTITFNGVVIADTRRAKRVLETSHPPVYYIPRADIRPDALVPSRRSSFCEFKGRAGYVSVRVGDKLAEDVGWFYPDPAAGFEPIRDHVAFYAGPMDACTVGGEVVTPQPGGFYGGWVTADVFGPFKGGPGTAGW